MNPPDLFTYMYNPLGRVIDKEADRNTLTNAGQVCVFSIIKKGTSGFKCIFNGRYLISY